MKKIKLAVAVGFALTIGVASIALTDQSSTEKPKSFTAVVVPDLAAPVASQVINPAAPTDSPAETPVANTASSTPGSTPQQAVAPDTDTGAVPDTTSDVPTIPAVPTLVSSVPRCGTLELASGEYYIGQPRLDAGATDVVQLRLDTYSDGSTQLVNQGHANPCIDITN